MHLGHVYHARLYSGLGEGGPSGMDRGIQGGQIATIMKSQGVAGLGAGSDLYGVLG